MLYPKPCLKSWYSHLGATLLAIHGDLNDLLWEELSRGNFEKYEVHWCGAKCNKMFCIKCRTCGWATFAWWAKDEEAKNMARKPTAALQDFVGDDDTESEESGYQSGHEM